MQGGRTAGRVKGKGEREAGWKEGKDGDWCVQDGRKGEREQGRVLGFDVEADREGLRRWEGEEWPVNTLCRRV